MKTSKTNKNKPANSWRRFPVSWAKPTSWTLMINNKKQSSRNPSMNRAPNSQKKFLNSSKKSTNSKCSNNRIISKRSSSPSMTKKLNFKLNNQHTWFKQRKIWRKKKILSKSVGVIKNLTKKQTSTMTRKTWKDKVV